MTQEDHLLASATLGGATTDSAQSPSSVEALLAGGWVYRDMPRGARLTPEMWDYFTGLIGEGNYIVLAMSQSHGGLRGQFLISPAGVANLRTRASASMHPSDLPQADFAPPTEGEAN